MDYWDKKISTESNNRHNNNYQIWSSWLTIIIIVVLVLLLFSSCGDCVESEMNSDNLNVTVLTDRLNQLLQKIYSRNNNISQTVPNAKKQRKVVYRLSVVNKKNQNGGNDTVRTSGGFENRLLGVEQSTTPVNNYNNNIYRDLQISYMGKNYNNGYVEMMPPIVWDRGSEHRFYTPDLAYAQQKVSPVGFPKGWTDVDLEPEVYSMPYSKYFQDFLEDGEFVTSVGSELVKDVAHLSGLLGVKAFKTFKLLKLLKYLKSLALPLIAFKLGVLFSPLSFPLRLPFFLLGLLLNFIPLVLSGILLFKLFFKKVKFPLPFRAATEREDMLSMIMKKVHESENKLSKLSKLIRKNRKKFKLKNSKPLKSTEPDTTKEPRETPSDETIARLKNSFYVVKEFDI